MSFMTKEAMNANKQSTIHDGSRQTLGKGEMVRFTDLPNQPIALVAYNNNDATKYVVSYNNEAPLSFNIDSVQTQGYSLGNAFLFNPGVTGAQEISVSVPETAQSDASIDVYLVSTYLPTSGINNIEIPLDGTEKFFSGYSRAYATPPLAWYRLNIKSEKTGLVGFIFKNDEIKPVAVNVASSEIEKSLKSKIYADLKRTGIEKPDVICENGNYYTDDFYGTSSQIVYSPVSSAKTTNNGKISIQKL